MIVSRPIKYTVHIEKFRELLGALGGREVVQTVDSTVIALPSGRVELRAPDTRHPAGTVSLGFEVADLVALVDMVTECGAVALLEENDGPQSARLQAPDGTVLRAVEHEPASGTTDGHGSTHEVQNEDPLAGITVFPLWFTPQVDSSRALLRTLGLVDRISSADRNWIDFSCPGGGCTGIASIHGEAGAVGVDCNDRRKHGPVPAGRPTGYSGVRLRSSRDSG